MNQNKYSAILHKRYSCWQGLLWLVILFVAAVVALFVILFIKPDFLDFSGDRTYTPPPPPSAEERLAEQRAEERTAMETKLAELILARQQEIADADGELSWRVRHVPDGVIVPLTERGNTPAEDMVIWERFLDFDNDGVDERISLRQEETPEITWEAYGHTITSTGMDLFINLEKQTDGVWSPIMEKYLLSHSTGFPHWFGATIIVVEDITGDGRLNVLISDEGGADARTDYTYALLGITDEKQGVLFNSVYEVYFEFNR